MKKPVVVIGIGEMGAVFARGLLRTGHPVFPVTRDMDIAQTAAELSAQGVDPELVLVAVAEKDLHSTLPSIPEGWKDRVGMLQNELLPNDWAPYHLKQPTVISVWFEKKKGQDSKVLIPSPVYGPHARLLQQALQSIDIACEVLDSETRLLEELILKNIYIVTTNVCGLKTGGTVGELWQKHEAFAREIANEVMDLQEALTGLTLDREQMIKKMLVAFEGDLDHNCMGRSAPARLERALQLANNHSLNLAAMNKISPN
jgi:ketopantoate reductase